MKKLDEIILKHALINAVTHEGIADEKAVIKKLLNELPELKNDIRNPEKRKIIFQRVNEIVTMVNSKNIKEQESMLYEKFGIRVEDILEEKAKKTRVGLPPLPGADEIKKVITRFAPAPSGALHIGQLIRAAFISYFYARMYNGKFILRIEDTDPRRIKKVYYNWIMEDLRKVGIEWDELVYESDHFEQYYEYTRKLFENGKAYVCTCTPEEFKKYKELQKPCPHRNKMDDVSYWEQMLAGRFREGEAVVRLKTDMGHKNPALRDPPLLRIIDTIPHPRTGYQYKVYPLYNYACALEDHMSGVTHVIRGKEHETNEAIQKEIYAAFGWSPPITIQYGMLKLPELKIHKRHIRAALREGRITGWDDITLPTVRALLRRGIHPEAFKKLAMHVGLTKSDAIISMETLYAFNRQILSPIARRLSFVEDPYTVIIKGIPDERIEVKMPWIPGREDAGHRIYLLNPEFKDSTRELHIHVSASDLKLLEKAMRNNDPIRLKDLMNITINSISHDKKLVIAEFHSYQLIPDINKIHWVPSGDLAIHARVLMPDGSIKSGLVEMLAQTLEEGEYVQLERFGFGRIDKNQGELIVFAYAHP